MTVLCVESAVVYADGVAAIAAEGGANKTFEVTGTNSFATSVSGSTYNLGISIIAALGQETTDDGDISVGAKMTGTFQSAVTGTDIRNLLTDSLRLTGAANAVLRRLIINGQGNDGIQYNDTIDAEDIIIYNCDDGFLSSVVVSNSLINKCTVVGASRFGYAQGKFTNCVDVNSSNQGFFNEAVGSGNLWENDGTGTNSITESPATDIFVDFAGGKYAVLDTSSAGAAGAGAFIFTAGGGGGLTLVVPSITSGESFGLPDVILNTAYLLPSAITTAESFGVPTVASLDQFIQAISVSSLEAFGEPLILTGGVTLAPTSITSQESLGTPFLVYSQLVLVDSITSEESFGIAIISDGVALVIPVGDRDTYQKIAEYLRATDKFVSYQNNEILLEWLRSEGIDEGSFNDSFKEYWGRKGYVGAYNDRWREWRDS